LLPELQKLQGELDEAVSFRKHNKQFKERSASTDLLNAAAEKLWVEKVASQQQTFQEHSSELHYLCERFRTRIDKGLTHAVVAEKRAELRANRRISWGSVDARPRSPLQSFWGRLCSSEFPPRQLWWIEVQELLVPRFLVFREGQLSLVSATELMQGDVLYIWAGQLVPADLRVLLASDSAAVDVSHVTSRSNDVRLCSADASGSSITESRNILLKDGHIISGYLFCIVVRSPFEAFVQDTAAVGPESYEIRIQQSPLPFSLSLTGSQKLFNALCVSCRMFCKSFKAMEQICKVNCVLVMLTQQLLTKGTVPAFVSTMRSQNKAVLLVNCNCTKMEIKDLSQKLGVECYEFGEPAHREQLSENHGSNPMSGTHSEEPFLSEIASTDLSHYSFEPVLQQDERVKLESIKEQLQSQNARIVVADGISQIALITLCVELGHPDKPMLYVMTGFNYPQCFRTLAIQPVHESEKKYSPTSLSEESTGISASPASPAIPAGGEKYLPQDKDSSPRSPGEADGPTLNGAAMSPMISASGESTSRSLRSDPAPHITVEHGRPARQPQIARGSQVFLSIDSIGIVSEHSDCILLESDLGLLGRGLDLVAQKLRR